MLALDPERVRVIHHAVDSSVFHPDGGPREPFVLYPARAWPHKNHALLFDAFRLVREARPELELVLTGGGHERLSLPDGVRSRGIVDRNELARLYRRASAVAFPSRYEGFGLPVLEAMSSGCPVIALRGTGAVEEFADASAVAFVDPDPKEVAHSILNTTPLDQRRVEHALALARAYSWTSVAQLHDSVYRELGRA
jgi:glycosyltransferase involved in cell wall biosynthesis